MSKILTDEELVVSARVGNETALDAVMKRHKSLVRMRARPYFLIGADRDDLIQEGMIGLFKAVRDFDPGLKVSFRAFAEMCITRQLMTAIKSASRQKHRPLNSYISLNRDTGEADIERLYQGSAGAPGAADPVESVLAAERLKAVRDITKNRLTPIEMAVVNEYLSGNSYREIAAGLGCQTKAVDNALQRVKRKMGNVGTYVSPWLSGGS